MPGIYIHIPFCRQACTYCDFHFSTSLKNKEKFIEALLREIALQRNFFEQPETISSVYFGGGTPSLLSTTEINTVFSELTKYFEINKGAEITLEANPDDLTFQYLHSLKHTPINRLSIGVQSFFNRDLKFMNRVHTAQNAKQSIEMVAEAGFTSLTIDLIYGTPGLSNQDWTENLMTAFALPVNHLSCYALTVEQGTALSAMIKKGIAAPVKDQQSAEQFEILLKLCSENGFEQYEISNFCRNEQYAIHNSNYWKGEKYLGLGPSAHSYNGRCRQWNVSNNNTYIKSLSDNKINFEQETLSESQKYNEYVLTSLRTKWGTSAKHIIAIGGMDTEKHFRSEVEKFIKQRLVIENENYFYLSDEGKLFADHIASQLFIVSKK